MPLKNDILQLLEQHRGSVYSGTALAERFGVSRNAVWKAVNSLKADGHEIVSDGRRGYLMSEKSDRLSSEGIASNLPDDLKNIPLKVYEVLDSTNNQAKKLLLSDISVPFVVTSEKQTAGRTRSGDVFYSPYGTGLYISMVLAANCKRDAMLAMISEIPKAVSRAVTRVTGISAEIISPADLYIAGRKVCGILIEGDTDLISGTVSHIIIGAGVNVTTEDFPDDLRDKAVSLGTAAVRCRLAAAVIEEIIALDF